MPLSRLRTRRAVSGFLMRLCFRLVSSANTAPSTTVKIMPLGDSITQGQNTSYGSYRRLLYSLLTADGIAVDFVGELSNGDFPDPDHEGLTGYFIDGIWGQVDHTKGAILQTYTPDMILLLIGTNDIWTSRQSPADSVDIYSNLLDQIATEAPDVKTIVGSIPPIDVGDATVAANVDVFNADLATLVASKGANFSFVDINAGLTTADLADGVHPTDAGNDKMAIIWELGVIEALGGFLVDGGGVILTDDDGNDLLSR